MTNKPLDDEHRVREAVFREMFETYFVRVVRYVEGQLSDQAVAEDLASEVFRVAWEKLDPEMPFGLPWLIRTAMHKTRDHQRRHYRRMAAKAAIARFIEEQPPQFHALDAIALYQAMKRLSSKDLEIVRLTYWDGLTAGEVASVLRMREGAVWTRLHRARAQLRVELGESSPLRGAR